MARSDSSVSRADHAAAFDRDRPETPAGAQAGILAGAPADLLEMYACWQRKRGSRAMPSRADHLPGQEWSPSASIYLPLSNDGARVDMVLVYSSFRWIAGAWQPDTNMPPAG